MGRVRTVHARIEGRVQGVGYRAWVESTAREKGLTGWVRNRRDTSVEIVLQGPSDQVEEMLRDCKDGPAGRERRQSRNSRRRCRRLRRLQNLADHLTATRPRFVILERRACEPFGDPAQSCRGPEIFCVLAESLSRIPGLRIGSAKDDRKQKRATGTRHSGASDFIGRGY